MIIFFAITATAVAGLCVLVACSRDLDDELAAVQLHLGPKTPAPAADFADVIDTDRDTGVEAVVIDLTEVARSEPQPLGRYVEGPAMTTA